MRSKDLAPKKAQPSSIRKNYFFNLASQLISFLAPLLTIPYVSRIFAPSDIGIYGTSYSFITYFTLLASFGFQHYGEREVAAYKGDSHKQSIVFWEIFLCRLVPSFFSICLFLVLYFCGVFGSYSSFVFIFSFMILGFAFDISFFFAGKENFVIVSLITIITRIISVLSIFLFIKSPDSLWVYCLISMLTVVSCFLIQWGFLPAFLSKVRIKEIHVFKHFLPALRLFIPTLTVSLYSLVDKTLIALLVSGETTQVTDSVVKTVANADVQNGYYEQADKIIKIALTLTSSLGSVMIPRNSSYFASRNMSALYSNVYKSCEFVWLVGIPCVFGILSIAPIVVNVFFGSGWEETAILLMLLSPVILVMGFTDVFGYQMLLPEKRDKEFTIIIFSGFVLNVGVSTLLIPSLWGRGAAIGTIIAESAIAMAMLFAVRKEVSPWKILVSSWRPLAAGVVMFAFLHLFRFFVFKNQSNIVALISLVAIGVIVYFFTSVLFREPLVIEGLNFIKKFFNKKGRGTNNENSVNQ